MYTKVTIDNFRCFEHLEVGPLARVNLITGANNVGKTALLEALYIGTRGVSAQTLADLARWRSVPGGTDDVRVLRAGLFREFREGGNAAVRLADQTGETRTAELVGEFVQQQVPIQIVSSSITNRSDAHRAAGEHNTEPSLLVPAAGWAEAPVDAGRLGFVEITGRADEMLRTLHSVEPRIRRVLTVYQSGPIIYADLDGSGLMPVSLMGDGLSRLLSVTLAASKVAGGVLLVDEIENGIYHKAMPDVWRGLAHAAREFDVQLFATTHSWECVRAAVEAFRDDFPEEDLHLHRLDRLDDGSIKATTYKASTLRNAVDMNAEVR